MVEEAGGAAVVCKGARGGGLRFDILGAGAD